MTESNESASIVGVAIRDLARLRSVAVIVAKHGFGSMLMKTALGRRLFDVAPEGDAAMRSLSAPVRFTKLLATLGPTFIKLGQILSMRKDVFTPEWIEALETLQDDAPRVDFAVVRAQVEKGLGGTLEELFASFDPEPLATASIAQTHRARTKDGEEVVVKVQRPGIDATMRSDLDLLYLGAQVLEASIDEMQLVGVVSLIEEFERGLLKELDFTQELSNLLEFQRTLDPDKRVVVPRPHPELSSRTVLTMQFFRGVPLRKLEPKSERAKRVVETIVRSAIDQVMIDGVFHGDPHSGNILVGDDDTVCMIDLGMVGRISQEQRDSIITLALAAIANDSATIARVLLRMGTPTQRVNLNELRSDIERIRAQFLVVENLSQFQTAGFIDEFASAAGRYRIKLAKDLAILIKSAATVEGIVRTLHPEIDLLPIVKPVFEQLAEQRFSPQKVMQELLGEAAGLGSLLRTLPSQLDQLLHDFETGNIQVRAVTPELDELPRTLHVLGGRLSLTGFAASTALAAALCVVPSDPSVVRIAFAAGLGVVSLVAWLVLLGWHWLGRGRPVRVTPLLRFFRR